MLSSRLMINLDGRWGAGMKHGAQTRCEGKVETAGRRSSVLILTLEEYIWTWEQCILVLVAWIQRDDVDCRINKQPAARLFSDRTKCIYRRFKVDFCPIHVFATLFQDEWRALAHRPTAYVWCISTSFIEAIKECNQLTAGMSSGEKH